MDQWSLLSTDCPKPSSPAWRAIRDSLPPDLTPSIPGESPCGATQRHGYICTRRPDHTGRHAAGDSRRILAVWS